MSAVGDRRRGVDGVALVLALLFILAFSSISAAVMVLSCTETSSSLNYRMMSQARYGAESGVYKAAHVLLNTYTLPGSVSDPLINYDTTVSPVTYQGQPVVLSAMDDVPAHYPVAGMQAVFAEAATGTLPAGGVIVTYQAVATLLSMQEVVLYGANAPTVVQTWQLTARGAVDGVAGAEVEVAAVLERQVVAAHTYAAFATNAGCGALSFSGGVRTNSYDSSSMVLANGAPVTQNSSGHVGTNGNLTEGGGSIIHGTLSTPRTGVGQCQAGAVTALTLQGNAQVTGGVTALPQAVQYQPPDVPSPLPPAGQVMVGSTSLCAALGGAAAQCSGAAGALSIVPDGAVVELGSVHVTGGATLTLHAGTYHINSLKLTGNATMAIGSGPVILNVAGQGDATPVDFEGGSTANGTFDPSLFRIHYAGTGALKLTGGTRTSAIVYAPLASATVTGGADFYGSILAAAVTVTGGAQLHYDRRLERDFFTVGPQMMSRFTWRAR